MEIRGRNIAHSHHSDVPQREEEHHEVGVGGALRELGDEVRQREEEQSRHQVHLQQQALTTRSCVLRIFLKTHKQSGSCEVVVR